MLSSSHPSPTVTYDNLRSGQQMFMEALHSLANSPDRPRETLPNANRYKALTTATRYGYGLYGPRESEEARKNERTWNRLKEEDPELAWGLYKNLNGVQDWPDWGSDLSDPEELSLDDDPDEFYRKYITNLQDGNPNSLCSCGVPHLDYKCVKTSHNKTHCQRCCGTPRYHLHCVL